MTEDQVRKRFPHGAWFTRRGRYSWAKYPLRDTWVPRTSRLTPAFAEVVPLHKLLRDSAFRAAHRVEKP